MKRLFLAIALGGFALLLPGCVHDDTPAPSADTTSPAAPRPTAPDALLPSPWTDPSGDVALSNADMIAGTVVVGDGIVELRVQFADSPFPSDRTFNINWCIDLDQNPETGDQCGASDLLGADAAVGVENVPLRPSGHPLQVFVLREGLPGGVELDPATHLFVEPASHTVRVCFPDSLLLGDTQFSYVVESNFGGSSGAGDWAPDSPGFGEPSMAFVNEVGRPAPCPERCGPSPAEACASLGAKADQECPCARPWRNHGQYVSCVAHSVQRGLDEIGDCLSDAERDEIAGCVVSARARSDCGKIHVGSARRASPVGGVRR